LFKLTKFVCEFTKPSLVKYLWRFFVLVTMQQGKKFKERIFRKIFIFKIEKICYNL